MGNSNLPLINVDTVRSQFRSRELFLERMRMPHCDARMYDVYLVLSWVGFRCNNV